VVLHSSAFLDFLSVTARRRREWAATGEDLA
jgi:hypothetical protein